MVLKRQSGSSSYPIHITKRKHDCELKGGIKGNNFSYVRCNKWVGLSTAQGPSAKPRCAPWGCSALPKMCRVLPHLGAVGGEQGNLTWLLSSLRTGLTFTLCRQYAAGCLGRWEYLSVKHSGTHQPLCCGFPVKHSREQSRAGKQGTEDSGTSAIASFWAAYPKALC